MSTMTVLQIVQSVLSSIDGDEVSSISDTAESLQVADVVRDCYFYFINDRDWPFQKGLSNMTGLGDTSNPTKMRIPTGMDSIDWVKYDKKDVTFLSPKAFKDLIDARTESTGVVNSSGYVINDDPKYWTTYDDDYVWFDGYDSATDSTLQQSKCEVYGEMSPTFTMSDSYVPDMPAKMFPTFLAEVKAEASFQIRQMQNARQERKAKRGRDKMQKDARKAVEGQSLYNTSVNFGRK